MFGGVWTGAHDAVEEAHEPRAFRLRSIFEVHQLRYEVFRTMRPNRATSGVKRAGQTIEQIGVRVQVRRLDREVRLCFPESAAYAVRVQAPSSKLRCRFITTG